MLDCRNGLARGQSFFRLRVFEWGPFSFGRDVEERWILGPMQVDLFVRYGDEGDIDFT